MDESDEQRTTLVLTDVRDEDGTMWRAIKLTEDGGLAIVGHDYGTGVERVFGCKEYEFERRLSASEVATLRQLLAIPTDDGLLAAVGSRFPSTHELESFTEEHGIAGQMWNWIGD